MEPTPAIDAPRASKQVPAPHTISTIELADRLRVDPTRGLDTADAKGRLANGSPNELEPPRRVSVLSSIVDAATEPFVVLLAVAGVLAVVLGEVRDGILILFGLVPIVGADVVTEFRAERALEELRAAAAPMADVRRDGRVTPIPARELVPGDVVILRVGDVVPADVRIVRSELLTIDRSVLTGESLPEETSVEPDDEGAPLADRRAMAYAGTSVVLGRGEGIVVSTGRDSELGRIAGALGVTDRGRSPLQREFDRLIRILLAVAIGLIVVTMSLGLIRGASLGEAVLAGISAAIAAIPEEPPVLLAVILGLGAYRLLRRGVLVRRLNAQETLGAVDLIVTDKTGTLTENRLALDAVLMHRGLVEDPAQRQEIVAAALRAEADAWSLDDGNRISSFTRALRSASPPTATRVDPADLLEAQPPRDDQPYSTTRARRDGAIEELALGAPEAVLALAGEGGEAGPWRTTIDDTAAAGRRLLLLAGRSQGEAWQVRALLSFSDTLREGIHEALRRATEAGIQTVVVTGDHPTTASTITRAAGLAGDQILTGTELDAMDDAMLARVLPGLHVVARATPEQKLRLVRTARSAGRIVVVTGDGVNDAPALQQADVAVAMGSGTAVAREAADIVLGDDSFVTLMDGLHEGRRIVANVQKGLVFLTSTHVALLGFILIATLAGFGQPLLPIQILWLELFIDLAASVAFEREPAEPDVMRRPPRPRNVPLLTRELLVRIAIAGGVTAIAALVLLMSGPNGDHARWVAFNALVFGQLIRAYANRSLVHPLHRLPANGFLALACLVGAAIQLAIPYVDPLAEAFRASPLGGLEWGLVLIVALAPALLGEVVRTIRGSVWVA